jgi:uncharacterized membrane protein YkvA (DUF1232 family)
MPMTVTLEISDVELDHFRAVMHRARSQLTERQQHEIAAAAGAAVAKLASGTHSPFVLTRIGRVKALIRMLEDTEWQLPDPERRRVLEGLAYVAESNDMVPDDVPVLGLVDDAIMLELVLRELRPELDGYEEFDAFRRDEAANREALGSQRAVSREDWLASKRAAMHERMRERRERDLARNGPEFPLITHW